MEKIQLVLMYSGRNKIVEKKGKNKEKVDDNEGEEE